jgi:hypothetical protein
MFETSRNRSDLTSRFRGRKIAVWPGNRLVAFDRSTPMPTPSASRESSSAFLPPIAFFEAGAGPMGEPLRSALRAAGFQSITGNFEKISTLFITPPGSPREQISPPGNDPRRPFDIASEITLLGGTIKTNLPSSKFGLKPPQN